MRTPGLDGETIYEDANREGLNLKIQRQAQNQSAKLWKLLSTYTYEWKAGDKLDFRQEWLDRTHDNTKRSWSAFATHTINNNPKVYQYDSSISLETWHDDIHNLVGTGSSPGHMGDPSIAAVGFLGLRAPRSMLIGVS